MDILTDPLPRGQGPGPRGHHADFVSQLEGRRLHQRPESAGSDCDTFYPAHTENENAVARDDHNAPGSCPESGSHLFHGTYEEMEIELTEEEGIVDEAADNRLGDDAKARLGNH